MRLCATCARHERTCCQDTDVLVTDSDIRRIEVATGRTDFWEFRAPDEPENREPYPDDLNWLDYTLRADGTRAQLKQQPSRDCVFLGPAGCTLAREARPLTCRLYPYDYNEREITGRHHGCPVRFLAPGQELFRAIGLPAEEAERWRARLYDELRHGSVFRENRERRRNADPGMTVAVGGAPAPGAEVAFPARRPLVVVLHGFVPEDAPPDEHDTLVQAQAVARSLRELGYRAELLPFGPDPAETRTMLRAMNPVAAFNLVETIGGSGRGIEAAPRLLAALGIPWTGAGVDALVRTTNKVDTKSALRAAGVATPPWMSVNGNAHEAPEFAGPWIVKSVWEHASVGLSDDGVVASAPELRAALDRRRHAKGSPWFVERYIDGREFVVSLLGRRDGRAAGAAGGAQPPPPEESDRPEVLAICEILFQDYPAGKPRIVNYAAKWEGGSFEHEHTVRRFLSRDEDPALFERIAGFARAAWRAFELRGYARVDFRVDALGEPWVVDLNSNPCIAPDSGFIAAAAQAGLGYTDVVRRILEDA